MEPSSELWECLRRVRSLRFVARSESSTGWNGAGAGSVAVGSPAEAVLTFTESGSWCPAGGRETRFSNVFRWSRVGPASVRLEHLRFGPDRPVYLFDQAPIAGGWSSVSPHVCAEDCYAAELQIKESGLFLAWSVAGPKKQERIEYEYRWAKGAA